jgi:hypothetical protein
MSKMSFFVISSSSVNVRYLRVSHRCEVWSTGYCSGKPMITSIQLSITLASIHFKILSDFVTSLKKVKSNTTVPYIELLNCVPAKPTSDGGTSYLLDLAWVVSLLLPCLH